ncbi:MAG: AEC family transporter [Rhodoferax sp.]|uniref:AEC family transporter n=3 Tax=Rhodoferax sp. TaxID=50421 RepID=UPI00273344A5|nr:AEC family transporter [Rhodoferax sp.]MDP3338575.1 AEC family transporter [Rhodoferax sp.]
MFLRIISIVFPIFIIVMIGFAYGRKHRPEMQAANNLNISVFLPALFFSALAGKSFNLADNLPIALGCAVVVLGSGALTWVVARLLGIDPKTLVPPSMFNNVGNMGLPLLLLTFGEQTLGPAVVLMLVVTVLQFTVGIWLLSGRFNASMLWREPLLAAAGVGIFVSLSGLTVWPPLMVATKLLGDIALGLMIFSLGVRLSSAHLSAWRIGLVGACVTPLTGMLVAWAFGLMANLSLLEQDMLFVFGALPPAVSSFIFAERYRQEPDKVASIVIMGNALALFFIPLALALRL